MKEKKWQIIFILLISIFITGCGSSDNKKESSSNTLKILLSEEPSDTNALNIALNSWAEESGNKVDKIVIPYDDQLTKFPLMLKNNDVPDLVATTRLTRLYPEEFMDLSKKIDTSIFNETALKIISQDFTNESVLAAPNQYTVTTYFYNVNALQEAGIMPPTEENPWTINEMYDYAEQLEKAEVVKYGFACDYSRARYDTLMYANGGSITEKTDDTFEIVIDSKENIDTLQKFTDENNLGVLPKVIWTGGSSDNPADYFKNGDVGIYLSGSWNYEQFYNDIKDFEFSVMPSPKGIVQQAAITGGSGLAIPESASNDELAVNFLEWLYDEKNYKVYLENDKGLSFINGITAESSDEKVEKDYKIMQDETKNVTDTFMIDEESGWRNYLDNEYRDYLKQAVSGELTPEKSLKSFGTDLSQKTGWEIK